ncbi:MAG: hypothetical protein AAF715_14220 [Myxococcota bacterium]
MVAVLIMGPVLAELAWAAWLMGVEIGRKQEVTAVVVALALWPLACVLAAKVKEVLERRKLAAIFAEPDAMVCLTEGTPRRQPAFRSQGEVEKPNLIHRNRRALIQVVGRIYLLERAPCDADAGAGWFAGREGQTLVGGVRLRGGLWPTWKLDVWLGEAIIIDRERNAYVCVGRHRRDDSNVLERLSRSTSGSLYLRPSVWITNAKAKRQSRTLVAPRNFTLVVEEEDLVMLRGKPSRRFEQEPVTRATIEARVGPVRDITYFSMSSGPVDIWKLDAPAPSSRKAAPPWWGPRAQTTVDERVLAVDDEATPEALAS